MRVTVLYQRLHDEQQLEASWGTFYRYVRHHWPETGRQGARVTVRLPEPPRGEEAQIDFFYAGRWHDPEEGRERRLYAFLMTLGHSRHQFLYPVLGEDSRAFLEGHTAGFAFFNGAPRRLIPDNLSAGILRPDLYDPRSNRAYGDLARHYGCLIRRGRSEGTIYHDPVRKRWVGQISLGYDHGKRVRPKVVGKTRGEVAG